MKSPSKQGLLIYFAAIALSVLTISQLGSFLVNRSIELGGTVELNSFIHFTHIRNLGGVFGMFQGQGWIFALFSFALIIALVIYLLISKSVQTYEYICFAFVVGGGSSNILDRLIYGSVVDFIDLQHIPFWHYIFNVADMMIHIGLWPMLLFSLRDSRRQSSPVN